MIHISLARVRDFRGVSKKGFDGRGNFSMGIKEHIIFPEIDIDKVNKISGLDVTFVATASTDKEAKSLLSYMKCKLPNFMLSLRKQSQDINENTCKWIPLPTLDKEWTDKTVYKYFKLTPEEKAENAKYWAMDVANQAAGATGEPGSPSEGGGGGGAEAS